MAKVSVHIVTYNSEEYIESCLQAVFAQTYPIEQVILIDNDSKDSTRSLLNRYSGQTTVIFNESNTGFAPAHNQAIRLSASDYYLILNPDVTLHPDYVRYLVEEMESDKTLGSVAGKLLLKSEPHLMDSAGLTITKARRAFDLAAGQEAANWNAKKDIFGVSGAAALYSRKMVKDISIHGQFFDEDFFAYKEDVDVAWRAQLLGWSSRYIPEALAYHERGWKTGARKKQPLFIRLHSFGNRYRMMLKNETRAYFFKHFPQILLFELTSFGYLLLREPEMLRVYYRFIKSIPSLMKKRKWIQSKRKADHREVYSYFL